MYAISAYFDMFDDERFYFEELMLATTLSMEEQEGLCLACAPSLRNSGSSQAVRWRLLANAL